MLDASLGQRYFLYGAHAEARLTGAPGELLVQRDGAICRATIDGAVWISHLKAKHEDGSLGIKLPAVQVLGAQATSIAERTLQIDAEVDYPTYREIRYEERDQVGYLHFEFYNGAMSTAQCDRLREAFVAARSRPTRVRADGRGGLLRQRHEPEDRKFKHLFLAPDRCGTAAGFAGCCLLESAASCSASTVPPRSACHGSRPGVNPHPRVALSLPGNPRA